MANVPTRPRGDVSSQSPEQRARRRAKYLSGLLWHAGVFLIVNGFFWVLDLGVGEGGFNWALWITGFWGLARTPSHSSGAGNSWSFGPIPQERIFALASCSSTDHTNSIPESR
jgi:hypothetical protein